MKKSDLAGILVVGLLVFGLGVPIAFGTLKPLIVLSGSMEPVMSPGDVTIVKEATPGEIERGDIMAFDDPSGRVNVIIIHRVIRINQEEGGLTFKTKGDAVEDPDPFVVKSSDVVGEVVFDIPFLGYLFHYGRNPIVFLSLVAIPATLIMLSEARKIMTYANPIRARKAERRNMKEDRKIERRRIDYKSGRVAGIFLICLAIFGSISLPCLWESGNDVKVEGTDGGLIPRVVAYKTKENSIPQYEIVSGEENLAFGANRISMLSTAPLIMPPFWIGALANLDPTLPSLVTFILPPFFFTLILYPVWRKPVYRGSRGKGSDHDAGPPNILQNPASNRFKTLLLE